MPSKRSEPLFSKKMVLPSLVVISLLGASLRIYQLESGLWYDEILTLVNSVRPPLFEILSRFPGQYDHQLYSVLAHLSIASFGESAWSLRLPAALFGVASIPLLYAFGTLVTTRFESMMAATLMTVSYHHVWFSQNARGYTALLFFALLSSYLLLIGLRSNRKSAFVAYAVVSALGIYAHLTMVFMVASQAAFAGLRTLRLGPDGRLLGNWKLPLLGFVLAGVSTLIFYAPIVLEVFTIFDERVPGKNFATASWALLALLRGLDIGFAASWGVILAGVLVLVGCWSYFRQDWVIAVLFLLPVPITLLAATALGHPIRPRFFFFLAGFGLLFAVRGGVTVGRWLASRARLRRSAFALI